MSALVADSPSGVVAWARRNLFRTWVDAVVTVVVGSLTVYVLFRLIRFVLVTGRWDVVRVNLKLFMVGAFPDVHLPRIAVSLAVSALAGGLVAGVVHTRQVQAGTATSIGMSRPRRVADLASRFWPIGLAVVVVLAMTSSPGPLVTVLATAAALVVGRVVGGLLPRWAHPIVAVAAVLTPFVLVLYLVDAVGWDEWGGIMLNVYLAVVSLILCFPLGVLAALGRRSQLPLIRLVATGYIELLRGAPLFVLLLMANVALGFFVPADVAPGKVARTITVFTLFTAAYVAEIVRGGLQSLPPGQEEAGKALGLSPTRITFFIVLPQALRNVIPAQVGQFISLFKDTTLAGAALGLFEMLQVGIAVINQPAFAGQGLLPESFAFVGLMFWVGSYTMSRESQRLEARLGVGTR